MTSDIDEDLYDRVLQFVAKNLGFRTQEICKIQAYSRMYHDLGCDGVDGYELLEAFSKEFQVEMSEFNFDKHFGPELPFFPPLWLFWWIFQSEKLNEKGQFKKVPITVMDLYEAARSKKWPNMDDRKLE